MYICDLGEMAKNILSTIKETPYNKEIIDSWREIAITYNFEKLYNTPEVYE